MAPLLLPRLLKSKREAVIQLLESGKVRRTATELTL